MTPEEERAGASALEKLERAYRDHSALVLKVCRRYFDEPMDVEDAAQETFLKAATRLESVRTNLPAFFAVAAKNVCLDELKRRGRELARNRPAPEPPHPEDEYLSLAFTRQLWEAMNGRDRRLLAHVLAGYQYEETAARTGMSPKAVSVAMTRARRRVRDKAKSLQGVAFAPGGMLGGARRRASAWANRQRFAFGEPLIAGLGGQAALAGALGLIIVTAPVITPVSASRGGPGGPSRAANGVGAPGFAGAPLSLASAAHASADSSAAATRAHATGAAALAQSILEPGADASHQDATFTSISASPGYTNDHTIYASGTLVHGCGRPTGCPVLFRSTDSGVSWQPLAATQFSGGRVRPSPDFDTDHTLVAAGPTGLQVSRDGGNTFATAVPVQGPVDISRGGNGHPIAVIGSATLLFYDLSSGALSTGPVMPAAVAPADDIAFAGSADHVLVTAMTPDPGAASGQDGAVVSCGPSACGIVMKAADVVPMRLSISPTYSRDGVAVAYGASKAWVSSGSPTFRPLLSVPGALLSAIEPAPDVATSHRLDVILQAGNTTVSIVRAIDLDGSAVADTPGPTARLIAAIADLPDGRLLVGLSALKTGTGVDFGIRCSRDAGRSWLTSC